MPRLRWFLTLLLLTLDPTISNAGETKDLADEGEQIYRTATRGDGSAVEAVVQNDVPLPPSGAACENCHRRSGFGISEGGSRSLNLTAPALFTATTKPPIRPAYDGQTLIRAIVAGIGADGRTLHPNMPRYELSADDAAALTEYLHSLGADPEQGVTESDLTIATVVADRAPLSDREAVETVLRHFVDTKNAGTRREAERAAASNRHYYGRSLQRAFRHWNLKVWTLKGKPSTWRRQLESHYAANPPFAIVSGATGSDWSRVHEFCEAREVPCLLPIEGSPVDADDDYYSLYFSSGPVLEARVTASHMVQAGFAPDSTVLVVHDGSRSAISASDTIRAELAKREMPNIHFVEADGRTMSSRKWSGLLNKHQADVIVAWLPATKIVELDIEALEATSAPKIIYTADTFSDWQNSLAPTVALGSRIRHVYPYTLPRAGFTQFPREQVWLEQRGLEDLNPVAAAKVLYAARVMGMGLADIQSNFSREYVLESLEHALDGTQLTSLYPRTSLGPNQRLLSRGAYVVNPNQLRAGEVRSPAWIQP